MDYENLIKPREDSDLGLAIQKLIKSNLESINTCFLARITAINGNKVSIVPALKRKQTDKTVVINNCMVGFGYSQKWIIQHKLVVGDIGLAITAQDDISSYKMSGNVGLNQTKRIKDINDSIFLPLSLFDSLNNDEINYIIKSFDGKCKLEFTNANVGILQAQLLALKSENTTLKTELQNLADILISGGGIPALTAWKSNLDNLFLE